MSSKSATRLLPQLDLAYHPAGITGIIHPGHALTASFPVIGGLLMSTALIEEIAAGYPAGIVPITVDQYHEMIRAGIIPDGSPIELIDGILMW